LIVKASKITQLCGQEMIIHITTEKFWNSPSSSFLAFILGLGEGDGRCAKKKTITDFLKERTPPTFRRLFSRGPRRP